VQHERLSYFQITIAKHSKDYVTNLSCLKIDAVVKVVGGVNISNFLRDRFNKFFARFLLTCQKYWCLTVWHTTDRMMLPQHQNT